MSPSELFDEIVQRIDPDEVPLEFILLAKVTDFRGNERILRGEELETVMRGPERKKLAEARVMLDVRKIRASVTSAYHAILDEVNRRNGHTVGDDGETVEGSADDTSNTED